MPNSIVFCVILLKLYFPRLFYILAGSRNRFFQSTEVVLSSGRENMIKTITSVFAGIYGTSDTLLAVLRWTFDCLQWHFFSCSRSVTCITSPSLQANLVSLLFSHIAYYFSTYKLEYVVLVYLHPLLLSTCIAIFLLMQSNDNSL